MNLQRREEIRKMCAEPARGGTQGAKQIFDLRDAVNELFAHIDTLEQTAAERVIADGKAPAVVVPGITPEDIDVGWNVHVDNNPFLGMADGDNDMDWIVETFAAGARHAEALLASRLRSISSDRVLGEGMVGVDREELEALRKYKADAEEASSRDCSQCSHIRNSQSCPGCTHEDSPQNDYSFDWSLASRCHLFALRANQGGA